MGPGSPKARGAHPHSRATLRLSPVRRPPSTVSPSVRRSVRPPAGGAEEVMRAGRRPSRRGRDVTAARAGRGRGRSWSRSRGSLPTARGPGEGGGASERARPLPPSSPSPPGGRGDGHEGRGGRRLGRWAAGFLWDPRGAWVAVQPCRPPHPHTRGHEASLPLSGRRPALLGGPLPSSSPAPTCPPPSPDWQWGAGRGGGPSANFRDTWGADGNPRPSWAPVRSAPM